VYRVYLKLNKISNPNHSTLSSVGEPIQKDDKGEFYFDFFKEDN